MSEDVLDSERWMRTSTYGGVWHKCVGDVPMCGTVLRGPEYEFTDGIPFTRHASYVCLRCYRIERGADSAPMIPSGRTEERLRDVETICRLLLRTTGLDRDAKP